MAASVGYPLLRGPKVKIEKSICDIDGGEQPTMALKVRKSFENSLEVEDVFDLSHSGAIKLLTELLAKGQVGPAILEALESHRTTTAKKWMAQRKTT